MTAVPQSSFRAARAPRDIAGDITARILEDLDQGVLPWRKPWDSARTEPCLPRRATGAPYRGVNVVLLWSTTVARGFRSPYWLSFRQAAALGGHVRRGARGERVVYYGHAARTPPTADAHAPKESFRFLKSYVVFNADQIEALPPHFHPGPVAGETMPEASHDAWFAKLGISRITTRDTAAYLPRRDVIAMPPPAAFDTPAHFAATLNHEACHATGAAHRLDRTLEARFGTQAYAAEELVAEIGAAILGAHLHLPPHHIHDHAAYIGCWMKLLQHDKRAFLTAAGKAQAAVDWLLAKSPAPAGATGASGDGGGDVET